MGGKPSDMLTGVLSDVRGRSATIDGRFLPHC